MTDDELNELQTLVLMTEPVPSGSDRWLDVFTRGEVESRPLEEIFIYLRDGFALNISAREYLLERIDKERRARLTTLSRRLLIDILENRQTKKWLVNI